MDFTNYRQHPRFGVVTIQSGKLMNDEVSVMKLNGESLRAKEEDLRPVGLGFKRSHYLSRGFGVYVSGIDNASLKSIVLTYLKLEVVNGDKFVIEEVQKIATQLELREELDDFMRDF
jgi:hypothetical protein